MAYLVSGTTRSVDTKLVLRGFVMKIVEQPYFIKKFLRDDMDEVEDNIKTIAWLSSMGPNIVQVRMEARESCHFQG